jgi:hypothetical protein
MARALLILFISLLCIRIEAQTRDGPAEKLALARRVWSPAMDSVRYDDLKKMYESYRASHGQTGPSTLISEGDFEKTKELFYEAMAEVLTAEDLRLQQRLWATKVGARMLSNLPRAMNGLPPLQIAREEFSNSEWSEWEVISSQELEHMRDMQQRLSRLTEVMIAKRSRLHP